MDNLKPCPFCGSGAIEVCAWENSTDISCLDCDYTIKCHDCDEEDAVDYWNTRPVEDALTAEVERMKDRVERLELLLFKIQETSTPHIGSIALYQAELKAINRWCKLALGKGNNPDTEKGGEDEQ